jgi:hypothetical protein
VIGSNAAFDEVGDAKSNDAGFASAGTGEDQNRPSDRLGGETLLGIQGTEV